MKSVSIVYCKPCGYLKRATDAAAALEQLPGVTARLVPGRGGIFEVRVGGQAVAWPSASRAISPTLRKLSKPLQPPRKHADTAFVRLCATGCGIAASL